jgi:BirA family biotin operon repressor/biotin-[acetyl-CoA-carboxylase] ligase
VAVAALARQLGEPIAAIQSALQALAAEGFRLEQRPVEGVGLADGPQPMLAEELLAGPQAGRRIGRRVLVLAETDSTSDEAWARADDPDADGLAVFADHQRAGRGRRGAEWLAAPASSVLLSVLLREPTPRAHPGAHRLMLAGAVAVAETLQHTAGLDTHIKWPNDVLVDPDGRGFRKIAGVLVEARRTAAGAALVIGIGLNVHQRPEDFPPELAGVATSVRAAGGRVLDRVRLAGELLDRLDGWVARAAGEHGAAALHDAWRDRSATIGRRVELLHDQRTFAGTVLDVDADRGLVVRLDVGGVRTFAPATVHVLDSA